MFWRSSLSNDQFKRKSHLQTFFAWCLYYSWLVNPIKVKNIMPSFWVGEFSLGKVCRCSGLSMNSFGNSYPSARFNANVPEKAGLWRRMLRRYGGTSFQMGSFQLFIRTTFQTRWFRDGKKNLPPFRASRIAHPLATPSPCPGTVRLKKIIWMRKNDRTPNMGGVLYQY